MKLIKNSMDPVVMILLDKISGSFTYPTVWQQMMKRLRDH